MCPFLVLQSFCLARRAGCFTFIVFLMSCSCYRYLSLPHGAMGWSAVCNWHQTTGFQAPASISKYFHVNTLSLEVLVQGGQRTSQSRDFNNAEHTHFQ